YAELTVDPDLIAGFVTAVIIFAKTPIRTIRKAAYDILIEVGESVLVLLVVDPVPDEAPYREKLNRILEQVETEHGDKLRHFQGDIRRFREFALAIVKEFPFSSVDLDLVPIRKEKGVRIPFRVGAVDHALEQIESFINGKRTIAEIMDLIGFSDDKALALISILDRYEWIEFKTRLTQDDVLVRSECPEMTLGMLKSQYGKPLEDILEKFDGTMKIKDVAESLPYDPRALWFLISKMVEVGCLSVKKSP
ncbi:MAG: hypothetical protein ACXAEF_15705, partial [Candidatus Thorarchaeota archaeon]